MSESIAEEETLSETPGVAGWLKPERVVWLVLVVTLVVVLLGYQGFSSSQLQELTEDKDMQLQLNSALAEEIELVQSEISSAGVARETIQACMPVLSALEEEVREIEAELSVLSLSTQSMWHNGWRGINRDEFNASVMNFSGLADSRVVEDGRTSCVSG